ncbi:hypothetical protein [Gluconacetobacter entanii]|uniref:hypothetical protein n=1 Tax=Gluconacetobacter entanii TaxID=108528 RepID=UPI001D12C739|nr:hypothetical protein [Gluconacetobacter entanii]MCW4581589.1 hypothetical protein [Gluconacetobacter entanii]MCW4584989.1 hypothetical protein [Gluconacetobacter entanii]MCW4588403.1 hypothetical protein [Gluconacetobacter entanii]
MRRFSFRGTVLLGGLLLATAPGAWAREHTRQQQARACQGDALRLCATSIPDEKRITACMQRKIDRLSPRCRAMFNPPGTDTPGGVTQATPPVAARPPDGQS